MIATPQIVAVDLAERQRRRAMAAAVFERGGLAARAAIEHDRLVQKRARDRLVGEVLRPDRGIPGVLGKPHARAPDPSGKRIGRTPGAGNPQGRRTTIGWKDGLARRRGFKAPLKLSWAA